MTRNVSTSSTGKKPGIAKKKVYQKPEILAVEKLEVVAATCDGGKAVFTGQDDCVTIGPVNS